MSETLNEWWTSGSNISTDENKSTIVNINGDTLDPEQPYLFTHPLKIKCAHSLVGGRGIFSIQDIEEGEIIERCPLVPLVNRSKQQTDPAIWSYCYTKPLCDCNECKTNGFLFYMVLGYGMIYNHQDMNNADMRFDHKNLFVDVIANKKIQSGKEIFVSYGPNYFSKRNKIVVNNENSDNTNLL